VVELHRLIRYAYANPVIRILCGTPGEKQRNRQQGKKLPAATHGSDL
jgi:hypothetical protein